MPDSPITPAQPSSTTNSTYPGVGIKRPQQGGKATGGKIKSSYAKKPKINGRGRSGDATGSAGAISSGGPGGSMGTKSEDIWAGSAFEGKDCTPSSPKCLNLMCKICQTKQ
jgi:hypothetical protein